MLEVSSSKSLRDDAKILKLNRLCLVPFYLAVIFNGCFMVLLSLWGPVTASVSCLLSTVAVAILDAVLRGDFSVVSFVGCLFIVGGFGVLLMEGGGHG